MQSMNVVSKGDLFESGAEALVNPVNTVGVAGKGLALEFKKRFPENHLQYVRHCKNNPAWMAGEGAITYDYGGLFDYKPRYIFNVATKFHWRVPSTLHGINNALVDLVVALLKTDPKTVAVPALGCGLGGLNWGDVFPLMEAKLTQDVLRTEVFVYRPHY